MVQPQIKQKGFTLIELLVVIAIIGILSSIGLSQMTVGQKKARDTRRLNDLQTLGKALHLYYDDYNGFPSDPGSVIGNPGSAGEPHSTTSRDVDGSGNTNFLEVLSPTYVTGLLVDPLNRVQGSTTYEYQYYVDPDGSWCGGQAGLAFLVIRNFETPRTLHGDQVDASLCPNKYAVFQNLATNGYVISLSNY